MIEQLAKTRTSNEGFEYDIPVTLEGLRDKMNEIIEAVNGMYEWRSNGVSARPSVPEAEPPEQELEEAICAYAAAIREVDRVDGTQDYGPVFEAKARIYAAARSVTQEHNARPQSLVKALADYHEAVVLGCGQTDADISAFTLARINEKRLAVFTAVHREYAQPVTIRADYEDAIPQSKWTAAEGQATAARQANGTPSPYDYRVQSAAQPGKKT